MININQNTNPQPKSKALTIFVVSGVATVLAGLILSWGALNIFGSLKPAAFYVFSNVASAIQAFSLLFRADEKLAVVPSNQSPNSGDFFTLTLQHVSQSGVEGEYSINYPCLSGLTLERLYNNKTEELACGQKVLLGNANLKSITLKTTLENSDSLDIPIIIYFNGDNQEAVYTQTLITVVNKNKDGFATTAQSASTTQNSSFDNKPSLLTGNNSGAVTTNKLPATPSTVSTNSNNTPSTATVINSTEKPGNKTEKTFVYYSSGPTPSNPNGSIDLEARILEVGIIDKYTNIFTASSSPSANLRIAVRFEVKNKGNKTSGPWAFNAVLPTLPYYIYSGDSLPSLMPGDRVEFTIGFDSIERKKDGEFIVNVDPTNNVMEPVKTNNIAKILINPVY